MDDSKIIDLFWTRTEDAIIQTSSKYGKYCYTIAYNILYNNEDSEECVNDTYLKAWNAIPPECPNKLGVYLGKITRNLSLDKYRSYNAEKRGKGQLIRSLDELSDCIPDKRNAEQIIDNIVLVKILNSFLASLNRETRIVFIRRYWYMSSVKEIASDYGMTENKVKMMMYRARQELKMFLEKEGVCL